MSRIVIVGYKPIDGKERELELLLKDHVPKLRSEGLVTDRKSILMKSNNGTVVEVFEWKSKQAIESAHTNQNVIKMWEEFSQVCQYVPIATLDEAVEQFSEFASFD